jgi:hypothetical protein
VNDIHDIKPALDPGADLQWIPWAAAVIVIALALLLWWLRRRQRRKPRVQIAAPARAPDVWAREELDELAGAGPLEDRIFYFRLSAIMRLYMEKRYGFPAAEMTTEELLPRIGQMRLPLDLAGPLTDFFRRVDPVKYAGAAAEPGRMSGDLDFARRFVDQTTAGLHNKNPHHVQTVA